VKSEVWTDFKNQGIEKSVEKKMGKKKRTGRALYPPKHPFHGMTKRRNESDESRAKEGGGDKKVTAKNKTVGKKKTSEKKVGRSPVEGKEEMNGVIE